jgi:2-polyprenyl-6-methoxyphenol hydroxylase-like FAD-dependent oxidoreductase
MKVEKARTTSQFSVLTQRPFFFFFSNALFSVINGNNNRSVAMFPLGEENRVRIMFDNGVLSPEEFDLQKKKPLTTEHFQELLNDTIKPLKMNITKVNWLTYYRVNERRAQEYTYKGRIFLAGDAAHVHSPAGGQGMNTGFQDVYNLAWKIALVVNGTAPPTLLNSYPGRCPGPGFHSSCPQTCCNRSRASSHPSHGQQSTNHVDGKFKLNLWYTRIPTLVIISKNDN